MNKLKSLFLKMKSKKTIKTYQKPLLVTIATLLAINLVFLVVASILGLIIDGEYFNYNFFKAFVHALSCMISTNTITKLLDVVDTHLGVVALSAMIIIVEMILFSGAIVATLTAAVRSFIDKKSKASGKIDLSDHFVILNYNSKVPDLIYNLIEKDFKENVIVLSNRDKDYISKQVESLIQTYSPDKKRKINLIVKEGDPLLPGNLDDISIAKASSIVIMSREDMEDTTNDFIENNDLNALKVLLTVGGFDISKNCNIVVETDTNDIKQKIDILARTISSLKDKSIIPVSFNKKIGQIISQTIINPAIASIYLELLSFKGCEFYSFGDDKVENFLKNHNNAIPIIKYHKLFALAEDYKDLPLTRKEPIEFEPLLVNEKATPTAHHIYVIGENKKSPYIIENLKLAQEGYGDSFLLKTYKKTEAKQLIEDLKNDDGEKKVLLLSDDTVEPDSYDANIFSTLISLTQEFAGRKDISYVTELLDSRNLNSVNDFEIKNAIISNRMMSLLITQLALNSESMRFFNALLTSDSEEGGEYFDIAIKKVSLLFDDKQPLEFEKASQLIQSFYYSFEKRYMLLGYIHDGNIIFIPKKQDETKITLDKDDELFYIWY